MEGHKCPICIGLVYFPRRKRLGYGIHRQFRRIIRSTGIYSCVRMMNSINRAFTPLLYFFSTKIAVEPKKKFSHQKNKQYESREYGLFINNCGTKKEVLS